MYTYKILNERKKNEDASFLKLCSFYRPAATDARLSSPVFGSWDLRGSESKTYSQFLMRSNKNQVLFLLSRSLRSENIASLSLPFHCSSRKYNIPEKRSQKTVPKHLDRLISERLFDVAVMIAMSQTAFGFLARRDNQNKRTFDTPLVSQSYSDVRCARTAVWIRASRFRSVKN